MSDTFTLEQAKNLALIFFLFGAIVGAAVTIILRAVFTEESHE